MNRIKKLRKEKHLTLKQLGKKLSMLDSTLSQYENGKRHPKKEIWKKLADFFGVSVPYLQGLTITREDILKAINYEYLSYLRRKKPNDSRVSNHLKLVGEKQPIDLFSKEDFVNFTPKIKKYWDDKFYFLYYCDRVTDIALIYTKNELLSDAIRETFINQIMWSIDEVDEILTSTKISKKFNKMVEEDFATFATSRQKMMRFFNKKDIREEVIYLYILLLNFEKELEKLPDNSEKQYSPNIAKERLSQFIKKKKAECKRRLYQDPL